MMKRGTSLVELIIAITVMSIFVLVFNSVYANMLKTYREEFTLGQLQSSSQILLDRVDKDIKSAIGVVNQDGADETGDHTLILKIPALSASNGFIYSGTYLVYDTIIYKQVGSNLHRILHANPASNRYPENNQNKILSKNLSSITFTYDADKVTPNMIGTSISLTKSLGNETKSINVSSKVKLRNN